MKIRIKKFLLLSMCLGLLSLQALLAQSWQWLQRYGSSFGGSPYDVITDFRTDALGNVYACGVMGSGTTFDTTSVTFYGGNSDIFIIKYNCDGQIAWIRTAGGSSEDGTGALVLDGNGYLYVTGKITAGFSSTVYFGDSVITVSTVDMFLAKYDTSGNFIWLQTASPGPVNLNSAGDGMQISSTGNIVIQGLVASAGDLFPGYPVTPGWFVAEFDPSGAIQSAVNISSTFPLLMWGRIQLDQNDNRYIGGYFQPDSITLGSTVLYRQSQNRDGFVAKFSPSGTLLSYIQLGDSAFYGPEIGGFGLNDNGEIWICGEAENNFPVGSYTLTNSLSQAAVAFVAKFDISGNCVFATSASPQYFAFGRGLSVFGDTVLFSGSYRGMGVFGNDTLNPVNLQDAFIALATTNGIFWSMGMPGGGSTDTDAGRLVGVDGQRNLYVSGSFGIDLQLGSYSVTSSGGNLDGFIAKYGSGCVTGIAENAPAAGSLQAYPNPATGRICVAAEGLGRETRWALYDTRGVAVRTGMLPAAAGCREADVRGVAPGLYLLTVSSDGRRRAARVVLE